MTVLGDAEDVGAVEGARVRVFRVFGCWWGEVEDVGGRCGDVGTVFHLHDDGAGLQNANRMPLAGRDVERSDRTIGRKLNSIGASALQIIVELFNHSSAQNHYSFRRGTMPVNRHLRTRLYGIQHPLVPVD